MSTIFIILFSINKMIDKMLIKNENSQKNYYLGKEINVVIINIVKEPFVLTNQTHISIHNFYLIFAAFR